ncbi:MAG: aldehyde ferredoxin oxidoreductase family protein [Dehalococcoidia bacterium]|nr:MAG: aldehyde ferredoxin oxidoreductase family protein [Dehalococcoidia bacterium]
MRKLLRVNLHNGQIKEEDIPNKISGAYVGGRGFGTKYVYDEIPTGTDPLGPDNKLLLGTGPLAGTNAQSLSKWMVYTKSPLTGTYTRSSGGGDFGAWLKWAGFELMIFEGKAKKPVYLYIKDGTYQLLDATDIQGETTVQTQEYLRKKHGARARMVCVGPAAEKMVRFAGIFSGSRAAGRGGTGAVMASKKLQAVVIEAARTENLADPDGFKKLVRQQVKGYQQAMGFEVFRDYGTPMGVDFPGFGAGSFPVLNFRSGELQGWEKISFMQYAAITQKHTGCYSCMLKCGKVRQVADGPYAGAPSEGPHYETIWAFSGPTGCTDLGATVVADRLCCELGIDTISTGGVIGFAYELFEKGILTVKDTDGLVLNYGDPEPMLKLIKKIGNREGLGDILAEGVKRAAERIGKGSGKYAMHVKGQELPGYEPRAMKALGMNYALSTVGANHCYGYAQQEIGNPRPRILDAAADENKGDVVKYNHDYVAAIELALACTFPGNSLECFGLEILAKMLVAACGEKKFGSEDYLWQAAERVYNLERCFNIREGFTRKDDALPERFYTEPLKGGLRDGEIIRKPDTIIDEYYDARGWDRNGIPTAETLTRLRLQEVDRDIAKFRN